MIFKNWEKKALRITDAWAYSQLFANCLPKLQLRIAERQDSQQPTGQVGFRKGYSTMDYIHVVNQVIEKTAEYATTLQMHSETIWECLTQYTPEQCKCYKFRE